jgi:hypothetical protein
MQKKFITATSITLAALVLAAPVLAKLPPPSDEAKAKAAEAATKTTWSNKVADFQLCRAMERTAAKYFASAKSAGKDAKPPTDTPPCADPGPFAAPGAAPAAAAPAAPAASAVPAKKA